MTHKICMIGLGYVGLPLAVEFARHYPVIGFDINQSRIDGLYLGHDATLEVEDDHLQSVLLNLEPSNLEHGLYLTSKLDEIRSCNIYIVTVPTPVDKNNKPDLTPLIKASETIGKVIKKEDIVIYESTVYPGCTEEDCLPVIEKQSGKKLNVDFYAGYSPERINPGDKEHTVTTIHKVTSGSTPEIAEVVDQLYKKVIKAGTHKAPSIRVAEMSKVIENSQRDINIAFVNELARICAHMGLDTRAVLDAAGTKWNFLKFSPGLVGGHCIGVDPYYIAQKAQEYGYHPEIILAGRRMNDGMGAWIAAQIVKLMIKKSIPVNNSRVLVLGITFKENCPDVRNTRVIDVVNELRQFGCKVAITDPWGDAAEVKHEYDEELITSYNLEDYDTIVLAVAHDKFKTIDFSIRKPNSVLYDIKAFLEKDIVDGRL
ncbi:MAG: nucleotide sugar dehydrogenase [Bacteroidota bacterium]